MQVGIGFTPFETRAEVILSLAQQADELGLDRVEVAEGWTHDSTILLAEVAQRAPRIGIGTSVISAWGRTPGTIAMTAASLQRLSSGRFSLGVGASSPPLTEGFHGIRFERPAARLRETLTVVRALLAGDRMPAPVNDARPLKLGVALETPVPIGLAALSPASIRVAGDLADAWAPFLWARSRIDEGKELLREGEARSAQPTPTSVTAGVPVALGPDEESARRLAAWWLATYCRNMGPIYPRMLAERFGHGAAVEAVLGAEPGGDLPAVAEELAREVTLMGTYDEAPELIAAWRGAGADDVALVLPPGRPEDELSAVVSAAAP